MDTTLSKRIKDFLLSDKSREFLIFLFFFLIAGGFFSNLFDCTMDTTCSNYRLVYLKRFTEISNFFLLLFLRANHKEIHDTNIAISMIHIILPLPLRELAIIQSISS